MQHSTGEMRTCKCLLHSFLPFLTATQRCQNKGTASS